MASLGAPSPLGRALGLVLATLTGLLYYVSFPGLDVWPLAFVAWIPWMVALEFASPRQAMLEGLAIGLVVGVFGFYWLLEMLQVFSGFSTAICALFMLILCAYQGGRFVLLGWLHARARSRGWPAGFVFTAAFAASETAYPLLFPFTFGASVHDVYPLVQVADLGGPVAVALVTLAPSWPIARLIVEWLRSRRVGDAPSRSQAPLGELARRVGKSAWLVGGLTPLVAAAYGLVRIAQVDAAVQDAEKLRVGIVQANMGLMEKREKRSEGLRRHVSLSKKLTKEQGVELLVWPETSVAGAVREPDAAEDYKRRVTGRLGVPAIVGAVIHRKVDDSRGYVFFNSALASQKDGTIVGRYDKQFLLAFGEYLPFGEQFPVLYDWSPNSGRFTPGTTFEPLVIDGHPIATFICYEDIVPSFVNRLMQTGEPELLVNMTNDAWFGDSSEPWEHMALAKMRAVEQRRFFVRSTNSGISGFVDPVGRLLQRTPVFEQAAIAEDVAFLKLDTLYRVTGNAPWWLLTLVAVGMAFKRRTGAPSEISGGSLPTPPT